jgi:S-methylmethionine-dependent homocysteine/selenocysteine methylase
MSPFYSLVPTSAYDRLRKKLEQRGYAVVDGGVATELERARAARTDGQQWGTWALYSAQTEVLEVHRRYVGAGCDVLSTNTWAILDEAANWGGAGPPAAWEQAADAALILARRATAEVSRDDDCAVAFCINGDLGAARSLGALELLTWRWREEAPDLVIFETLDELPGEEVFEAVAMVTDLGLPVWVSMRRAAGGMASADGQVKPDAHRSDFRRAVERLEAGGVSALLVNCVPRSLLADAVSEFTRASSLPVGCLPNLGSVEDGRWQPDDCVSPEQFAGEALQWLEAGAQIIGGCCGVDPDHIRAVHRTLERAVAWSARGV